MNDNSQWQEATNLKPIVNFVAPVILEPAASSLYHSTGMG